MCGADVAANAYGVYNKLVNPNAEYQRTWEDLGKSTGIGVATYLNPLLGIPLGLTEAFYPGGIIKAFYDRGELERQRREAMGRLYLPLSVKSYQ